MKDDFFEEILTVSMSESRVAFVELLSQYGMLEYVAEFPKTLCNAIEGNQALGMRTPNFGLVMDKFVERINESLSCIEDAEKKREAKDLFSAFGEGLFDWLQKRFPAIRDKMRTEVVSQAKEMAKREGVDAEDLAARLPIEIDVDGDVQDIVTESVFQSQSETEDGTNKDFFDIFLDVKTIERLEEIVHHQQNLTLRKGHLRSFLLKRNKEQKPLKIAKERLPFFVRFFYLLWKDKKAISPVNGKFWETIQRKLTDPEDKVFDKDLKKLNSRITTGKQRNSDIIKEKVNSIFKDAGL